MAPFCLDSPGVLRHWRRSVPEGDDRPCSLLAKLQLSLCREKKVFLLTKDERRGARRREGKRREGKRREEKGKEKSVNWQVVQINISLLRDSFFFFVYEMRVVPGTTRKEKKGCWEEGTKKE